MMRDPNNEKHPAHDCNLLFFSDLKQMSMMFGARKLSAGRQLKVEICCKSLQSQTRTSGKSGSNLL